MQPYHVVIVGGGTAGWLSAGIIASKNTDVQVTLIESPQVKNLGVGEGTWPTMRETLRQIGIGELEFLRHCQASFKQASKFVGWQHGGQEAYYHPFSAPAGYGQTNLAGIWQPASADDFARQSCAQVAVCEAHKAPKSLQMAPYAYALNYGYHLDAGGFVELLHSHCTAKLGVNYLTGHVEQVNNHPSGAISHLILADGRQLNGDLFIDCSGFAARLIGQHYGIKTVSCKDVLFNDAALAVQVAHADAHTPVASATVATARDNGWIWDIALAGRRGIGHVFSRSHTDADCVEASLREYISRDNNLKQADISPRLITFEPGYRQTFWQHNCVAIGVSAGFVEPLEATALVLIEKSAEWIASQLPRTTPAMQILARRFNAMTTQRWADIVDFLKLHYALSQRQDTAYWRDHQDRQSWPESLAESLALWESQPPWLYESREKYELFSSASKQYVLYGMGFSTTLAQPDSQQAARLINETRRQTEKLLAGLPENRAFTDAVAGTGQ